MFWPVPDVESAFVVLTRRDDRPAPLLYQRLSEIVKVGFSQRRKKLSTVLCSKIKPAAVIKAFDQLKLDDHIRAENLTVEEYISLTQILSD